MHADADAGALAEAIFSGRAGGAWETRSGRVRELASLVYGEGQASVPSLPQVGAPLVPPLPELRGHSRHRAPATATARALIDALAGGELRRLARLLHEHVWVLWADGTLGRHRRADLVPFLAQRSAHRPVRVILEKIRSYTAGELRSVLGRGIPEAMDSMAGTPHGITVMLSIETPITSLGRVMIMTSLDRDGEWRAHNLPLAAVDDAHIAGAPPADPEDEPSRVADRIVRHLVLGHGAHLRALRGRMMRPIWVEGGFAEPARLEALAGEGVGRAQESVFLGTTARSLSDLRDSPARAPLDRIRARAREIWGRSFDRWTPRAAATRIATLEPSTLRATTTVREIVSLLLGAREEGRGEPRWRLGGILSEIERPVS